MTKFGKPPTRERLPKVGNEDVDFRDNPERDDAFWRAAELVEPDPTERIAIRVKRSALDRFRAPGKGYRTRIDRVLEGCARARRGEG